MSKSWFCSSSCWRRHEDPHTLVVNWPFALCTRGGAHSCRNHLVEPEPVQLFSKGNDMIQLRILMLLILWGCSFARTQVTEEWVRRYNGPAGGVDVAHSVVIDGAGNVYVTGSAENVTNLDYATLKYDASGAQQWVATYDGPGHGRDEANSIAVDGQGNVYVTGWSNPIQFGENYDYATIKYNSLGVQQWVARYNGPDNGQDRAHGLVVDGQGNVYVTGERYSTTTTADYATIKYNSTGVQQWARIYTGTPGNISLDQARSIALDTQGNVYVTGRSTGPGYDYATIKYDPSGNEVWVRRYNRPLPSGLNGEDDAASIVVDGQGNVYVTGFSQRDNPTNAADYATVKYNSSGVEQWVGLYSGDTLRQSFAKAIAVDNSGNVYVTGLSQEGGTPTDYATVKYDANGNQQWVQRYDAPGDRDDNANSIAVDGQGNVYVTGESWGTGSLYDCATIKYNTAGVQQWVQLYNGPGNGSDYGNSVAVDAQGGVYVTGWSAQSGTNFDYVTIKYSQPTSVSDPLWAIPNRFSLEQNYPNPFNPNTTIRYGVGSREFVTLKVLDLLGREVATLVNEMKQPGMYEVRWDAQGLASGTYFSRLTVGNLVDLKKLVLMK
jgi:uncharacterized delta-60 repeat protein